MASETGIAFVRDNLNPAQVAGRHVLEVGALDVNGSARPDLEALGPASYLGVDISPGPRVDEICDVGQLVSRFGAESADVLVATELVEHVREWRQAFHNMKSVLRPGGTIVVTTRSRGFRVHGYPYDFWRYQPEDMRAIFADFDDVRIETDPSTPGVFVIATKPQKWSPSDLGSIDLYSVVTRSNVKDITDVQERRFKLRYHAHRAYRKALPEAVRVRIKRFVRR